MNILFLFPHPAVDRSAQYRAAARHLRDRWHHHVVFVYTGDRRHYDDDLSTEHFESWVEASTDLIERTTLHDLEREFPKSNLWRCLVAQRTLADYSYIGRSFPRARFTLEEIERYLKAVVLFYRHVIATHGIQLAVAHAPDQIHSHVLYELALSLPMRAINQYYDPYWKNDGRYCVDGVAYTSSWLKAQYDHLIAHYDTLVRPREAELEGEIARCLDTDPRQLLAAQRWPTSLRSAVRTSIAAIKEHPGHFTFRRMGIVEAYSRYPVWRHARAWLVRAWHLIDRRLFVRWSTGPSSRPFVFFGLHYQPESSTLARAPVWSDMLAIIRMLSASLPSGFQLIVKDHPIIGGLRSGAFYRAVTDLPNVALLPESYPTTPLIEGSAMVVSLTGTLGLQALMRDRPVLLLGSVYYDCLEGIIRPPANLNDLPLLLKDVLINGHEPDPERRHRSLLAFMGAYRAVIVTNQKMERGESPDVRGEGLAELIQHWITVDLAATAAGNASEPTAMESACPRA